VAQPDVADIAASDFAQLTADPRHYGFHATLKAPFALADGVNEAGLIAALADFAAQRRPFDTVLSPQALGRFLAFRPLVPCPHIQSLHEDAVRAFEPFRAPLAQRDLERRRASGLTPEQDALMVLWGYPYVFEYFRFHMTLTNAIADDALRQSLLEAATGHFAADIGLHRFASLSLFRQSDRDRPFDLIARAAFAA
jgi:2'-5' RNA ligase